jgi:hypothetical protein
VGKKKSAKKPVAKSSKKAAKKKASKKLPFYESFSLCQNTGTSDIEISNITGPIIEIPFHTTTAFISHHASRPNPLPAHSDLNPEGDITNGIYSFDPILVEDTVCPIQLRGKKASKGTSRLTNTFERWIIIYFVFTDQFGQKQVLKKLFHISKPCDEIAEC